MTTKPRLSSFRHQGVLKYGLVVADGIVDLSKRHPEWQSLREVIEAGALVSLSEEGAALSADIPLSEITFEIPIPSPEKIICVGVNFPDRNEEYKDGQVRRHHPIHRCSSVFRAPLPATTSR